MLTRGSVLKLVGPTRLDDHAIVEIIATGASQSDLVEALSRLQRGGEVGAEKMKPMSPIVARLCDILTRETLDWDEFER